MCPFRCDRRGSQNSAVGTATTLRATQPKDHVQSPTAARYSETHPVSCSTDKTGGVNRPSPTVARYSETHPVSCSTDKGGGGSFSGGRGVNRPEE